MKNILSILLVGFILYSCNNPDKNNEKDSGNSSLKNETQPVAEAVHESHQSPHLKEHENLNEEKKEMADSPKFSTRQIINEYLSLKNALAQDNPKSASAAAKKLYNVLKNVDVTKLDVKKGSEVRDIFESATENAEHISENVDLVHQREHLLSLSKDMTDLIGEFGTGGLKLYQDFCPMYKDGKGGIWISESKEIINPYQGQEMLDCGTVKKVL